MLITILEQIGTLKELTEFGTAVSQWAPWLVMAFILLVYMRQQGAAESKKTDNITELIKALGTIQKDSDDTQKAVAGLAERTEENTEVIEVFSQTQRDVKVVLETLDKSVTTLDKSMHSISDTYVQTTNDYTDGLKAFTERLLGRYDKSTVDIISQVQTVPQAVSDKLTPQFDAHKLALDALTAQLQEQISKLTQEAIEAKREAFEQRTRAEFAEAELLKLRTPKPSEPLADVLKSAQLSLGKGDVNRAIIDAAHKSDDDKPEPPEPSGAVDPNTGEIRKVA